MGIKQHINDLSGCWWKIPGQEVNYDKEVNIAGLKMMIIMNQLLNLVLVQDSILNFLVFYQ